MLFIVNDVDFGALRNVMIKVKRKNSHFTKFCDQILKSMFSQKLKEKLTNYRFYYSVLLKLKVWNSLNQ